MSVFDAHEVLIDAHVRIIILLILCDKNIEYLPLNSFGMEHAKRTIFSFVLFFRFGLVLFRLFLFFLLFIY